MIYVELFGPGSGLEPTNIDHWIDPNDESIRESTFAAWAFIHAQAEYVATKSFRRGRRVARWTITKRVPE